MADPSFRGTLGHRKILKIRAQSLEYSTLVLTARNMEMNFVNSTMHDDASNLYMIISEEKYFQYQVVTEASVPHHDQR